MIVSTTLVISQVTEPSDLYPFQNVIFDNPIIDYLVSQTNQNFFNDNNDDKFQKQLFNSSNSSDTSLYYASKDFDPLLPQFFFFRELDS